MIKRNPTQTARSAIILPEPNPVDEITEQREDDSAGWVTEVNFRATDGGAADCMAILLAEPPDGDNPVTSDAGVPFCGLTQGITNPSPRYPNNSTLPLELTVFEVG